MKKIYIITGFLGAGKTTFMNHLIKLFPADKLKVIVNEFGTVGVDGDTLRKTGVRVEEINNGSIFCSCRMEHFEKALNIILQEDKEVILVETSGLSDTTKARNIICNQFPDLCYSGCICLVDLRTFHKVLSTALVVEKQAKTADIFLLSKPDLVEVEDLEDTKILLQQLNSDAKSYAVLQGEIERDLEKAILELVPKDKKTEVSTQDITTRKYSIHVNENIDLERLKPCLKMILPNSYRLKGYLQLQDGLYLLNGVGNKLDTEVVEELPNLDNILVILSGGGMATKRSIKNAIEKYPNYISMV